MKPILKALLPAIGIPAAVVMLGWGCGILYWHVRIRSALRTWEKEASAWNLTRLWRESGAPPDVARFLEGAGCRALPHFIDAPDRSGKPEIQEALVGRLIQSLAGPAPRNPEAVRVLMQRYDEWEGERGDTTARRERKYAKLKTWWRLHGHRCHKWWRWWSASCGEN